MQRYAAVMTDNGLYCLSDKEGKHLANFRVVQDMPKAEALALAAQAAAAPLLLAALEHLFAIAGTATLHAASLDKQGLLELHQQAEEAARAAIAAAKGE